MKKLTLTVLLLPLLFIFANGQSEAFSLSKKYDADSLRQDLQILQRAMEEVHPGLYRYSSKSAIDSTFEAEIGSLQSAKTYHEFVRILSRINAPIHCIHTHGIHSPAYESWRARNLKHFPFLLRYLGNKLYIIANYSETNALDTGTEILEINGKPAKEVIDEILPELHSDGLNNSFKIRQIETRFAKIWSNLRDQSGTFELKVKHARDGKQESLTVQGISKDSLGARHGRYRAQSGKMEPITFKYVPEAKAGILTIRTFNDAALKGFGINYSLKLHEVFKALGDSGATQLVIDLRDNTGGATSYGMLLYAYISDPGFEYIDRVTIKKNKDYSFATYLIDSSGMENDSVKIEGSGSGEMVWANYPNSTYKHQIRNRFKGKVHLIVNGGTLSSASVFSSVVHYNKRGRLYGEETGGAYVGPNGAPLVIRLPHSDIRFAIPTAKYEVAVAGVQEKGGVKPDFPYQGLIHDYLGYNDPVLKVVMSFVKSEVDK